VKRQHSYSPARDPGGRYGGDLYREFDFRARDLRHDGGGDKDQLSRLCFKGPMEELTQTVNLQPALTAVNLACLAVLQRENVAFDFCAATASGSTAR